MQMMSSDSTKLHDNDFTLFLLAGFVLSGLFLRATILPGFIQQCSTLTYSETLGTVSACHLQKKEGSSLLSVVYTYTVEGKVFEGNQYCFDPPWANTDAWEVIQQSLPVGQQVPVYFDPSKPADSVLVRGPVGFHCANVWFAVGIFLVAPFIWYWIMDREILFVPTDARLVVKNSDEWKYHPNGRDWWSYWTVTALAVCFAGSFACHARNLPLGYFSVALGVLFVLPLIVAYRCTSPVAIQADYENKSWTLFSRSKSETIPMRAIHAITVERDTQKDSTGHDEPTRHFRVVVHWYTAEAVLRKTRLDRHYGELEAQGVAAWLEKEAAARGGLFST